MVVICQLYIMRLSLKLNLELSYRGASCVSQALLSNISELIYHNDSAVPQTSVSSVSYGEVLTGTNQK